MIRCILTHITGRVVNAQDYYSFGGILRSYETGGLSGERYKFTGKERDTETNYDYFGARYYDSDLGRWLTPDPLADRYPGWSPYNYCLNNPMKYIDSNGMYPCDDPNYHYDPEVKRWVLNEVTVIASENMEWLKFVDSRPDSDPRSKENNSITMSGIVVSTTQGSDRVVEGVLGLDKDVKIAAPGLTKVIEGIGKVTGILNLMINSYKLYKNPSLTQGTSVVVDLGLILIKDNPWVAAGLTVFEVTGWKDQVLNYIYHENTKK